jgi:hypothetical protein
MGFYTTKTHNNAVVTLKAGERVLLEEQTSINPGKPYSKEVAVPSGIDEHDIRASISVDGNELIAYSPIRIVPQPKPEPYTPPGPPESIENIEVLFLAGQRIDQFHNPSLDPDPYYLEVLRRDSSHIGANTEMEF